MSATLEILTQNDAFLELLAEALDERDDSIQGFLYADHHVIRDINKPWAEQEIWRRFGADDATNDAMMRQIGVERLRKAVRRVRARISRPYPHQEDAAEKVRALLSDPRGSDTRGGAT